MRLCGALLCVHIVSCPSTFYQSGLLAASARFFRSSPPSGGASWQQQQRPDDQSIDVSVLLLVPVHADLDPLHVDLAT